MKNTFTCFFIYISFLFGFPVFVSAQQDVNSPVVSIGFYNVENLFDTINNMELESNDEFTPSGKNNWTAARYHEKLSNIAFVIADMATDVNPDGLCILGLAEIENKGVLLDLVKEKNISGRNYQIVHFDSPDERGIDVGLLYQPKYFRVTNSRCYTLIVSDTSYKTRNQLVVSGILGDEQIHIIVNHWPSRRGGEQTSSPFRNAAADLTRSIVDSLLAVDQSARILVMGDMNDDPINESVISHLKTKGDVNDLQPGDLFNPMFQLYKDGIGTLAYKGAWNLFDQIIISSGLLGSETSTWKFREAKVFNKDYLIQKDGEYAGYPLKTFGGSTYLKGYSDHFPVYVNLFKIIK
jgi:hypothetical protein